MKIDTLKEWIMHGASPMPPEMKSTYRLLAVFRGLNLISANAHINSTLRVKVTRMFINKTLGNT